MVGLARLVLVTVVALAFFVSSGSGLAATGGAVLDQDNTGTPDTLQLISLVHGYSQAQTFTAGRTGRLTDVVVDLEQDFFQINPGDIQVAVTGVTSGLPDAGNVLATATIPQSAIPVFTLTALDAAFASPASVVAGGHYAIVLSELPPSGGGGNHAHFFWGGFTASTYAGGGDYEDNGSGFGSVGGDLWFQTYVAGAGVWVPPPPTASYCAVAGNTWPNGSAIAPGTFLYLLYGQPAKDAHYTGATPAIYVQGKGITCDPPPAGYTLHGTAGDELHVPGGLYPYYAPA